MKRCPVCEKTFDDSMRFCQADGTPLVADEAPVDPYKTMVARPESFAAASSADAAAKDEEVLQIPADSDPRKTMYASEDEIRREMDAPGSADEQVIDIPPLVESAPPEPPKFSEPSLSPPTFGDAPPASPFGSTDSPAGKTGPAIPSPFSDPKPATYEPPSPDTPKFAEPGVTYNPFEHSAPASEPLAAAEWTPPSAPDPAWQNHEIGQNTPFQPPPAGAGGQSQTLAVISLVVGVLSIFCCGWFVPGIAAVVMGFIAKNKADSDPANFGGRSLALGGIITGALSLVLGVIVVILYLFGFLAGIIGNVAGV